MVMAMRPLLYLIIILLPHRSFCQIIFPSAPEPTGVPEAHYYAFVDGLQMVEFDYLSAHRNRVDFLEMTQPRALTWEMVLGPPPPNVYIFRNAKGEIVKKYGETDLSSLLSVEASLKKSTHHNGNTAVIGNKFGYPFAQSGFWPYYLVGSTDRYGQGNLGLIDSFGNIVLQQTYDAILPAGQIFIVNNDSTVELRDQNMHIRFSSSEYYIQPAQFHPGYVDIEKDDKWGLMDATGKFIVPCAYITLIGAFDAYGLARVESRDGVGFIDTIGNLVIPCKYQNAGDFSEGLINVRLNDKWGYIDTTGQLIIPIKYEIGIAFSDGLARVAVREGSKYYFGFIDRTGKEVIPLVYENAGDFKNGFGRVLINGNWMGIDKAGKLHEIDNSEGVLDDY